MPRIDDCFTCCYYSWDFHLVCAVHPTGPENESCNDCDHHPETEAILYEDFLGIGEAEVNDTLIIPGILTLRRIGRRRGRNMLMGSGYLRKIETRKFHYNPCLQSASGF